MKLKNCDLFINDEDYTNIIEETIKEIKEEEDKKKHERLKVYLKNCGQITDQEVEDLSLNELEIKQNEHFLKLSSISSRYVQYGDNTIKYISKLLFPDELKKRKVMPSAEDYDSRDSSNKIIDKDCEIMSVNYRNSKSTDKSPLTVKNLSLNEKLDEKKAQHIFRTLESQEIEKTESVERKIRKSFMQGLEELAPEELNISLFFKIDLFDEFDKHETDDEQNKTMVNEDMQEINSYELSFDNFNENKMPVFVHSKNDRISKEQFNISETKLEMASNFDGFMFDQIVENIISDDNSLRNKKQAIKSSDINNENTDEIQEKNELTECSSSIRQQQQNSNNKQNQGFNIKLNDQNLPNLNQQQYIRKSHNESKLKNRGFGFSNRLKNKENKF
jgi:hypothetical protein